jgi:hypothetical protein
MLFSKIKFMGYLLFHLISRLFPKLTHSQVFDICSKGVKKAQKDFPTWQLAHKLTCSLMDTNFSLEKLMVRTTPSLKIDKFLIAIVSFIINCQMTSGLSHLL